PLERDGPGSRSDDDPVSPGVQRPGRQRGAVEDSDRADLEPVAVPGACPGSRRGGDATDLRRDLLRGQGPLDASVGRAQRWCEGDLALLWSGIGGAGIDV